MLSNQEFRNELESVLNSRLTLDHPILLGAGKAEKNLPLIRKMALQGFQLTKVFARYVAMLYYHCPLPEFSYRLAVNLYEEETGMLSKTQNHLKLMKRFIFALGVTPEELEAELALPSTEDLIEYRRRLCADPATLHMGAAAVMVASEGQNLEKKAGSSRHELIARLYGLKVEDLAFFSVHAEEDVYHVADGLDMVTALCVTSKMQREAIT